MLSMIFVRAGGVKFLTKKEKFHRILFHAIMVFLIITPFLILVRYAYSVDYQAQGRYIMPGIIPFMYYISRGLEKLPLWRKASEKKKNILCVVMLMCILLSLLVTIYVYALPYYLENSVL